MRIVLPFDGSELIVVSPEERLLPVEFISRCLRARDNGFFKKELSRKAVNRHRTLTSLRYAPDSGAIPSRILIS